MDSNTTRVDPRQSASTEEIVAGLNDLLQLDHDAIGSYEIAMERLEDRDHASQIAGFRLDHERHVRELTELIRSLGGTPKNEPHATGPLKQALQGLGAVAGDKGLLMAFRTNELQVRTKYDGYASKAVMWPAEVKRVIDGNALDEERHYRWVSEVLGKDENEALDKVDAARERAGAGVRPIDKVTDAASEARERVLEASEQARERVADVAGTVRERVAGGVDAVRNRLEGVMNRDGGHASASYGEPYDGSPTHRTDALAGRAREAGASFEHRFQEQPLQTLLIAGIAGFVIGRLLR